VSSAKVAVPQNSEEGTSEVKMLYRVGDRIAPWGTPKGILCDDDLALPTLTWKDQPLIKEKINLARKISQPRWRSLCSSALCQTESNAFSTSRSNFPIANVSLLVPLAIEFRASLTFLTTLLNWCTAVWAVRNPNWWFGKKN
jgi:hypothetical protein